METRILHPYRMILSFILTGLSTLLAAQTIESTIISKLSTEEGLPSNIIYSILQDQKGIIWIGTEQGLCKYDGKNMSYFVAGNGRHGLSHNRNQTMLLAPDGNIWAGTSDGLNIYDYRSDSIIQVRTNTQPLKLVYNDITVLSASTHPGITWLGTYGNGVHFFDWNTREFKPLNLPESANGQEPQNIMSLLEDDNHRLWIGTQTNGLFRYDSLENRLLTFNLSDNGRFIRVIFQDSFRRIWIGTSKGAYVYNETTNRLDPVIYPEPLISNSIGAIHEDRNGKLWIGTESFLMNFSVRSFSQNEHFSYQLIEHGESVSRLSCPSVNTIFADQGNNIWIGTAWGGVNMLKGTPAKFKLFRHEPDDEYSLPSSPINAICSHGSGQLVLATMGTGKIGLCTLDLNTGKIEEIPLNKKLPGFVYQSIVIDSDQNLWIGTYNRGLIRSTLNGTSYDQWWSDPGQSDGLPGNDVRSLFESHDHRIWIGTNNGLAFYDKKNKQISEIRLSEQLPISVRAISEDTQGKLWLGTYGNGIVSFDPETGTVDLNPTRSQFSYIIHDLLITGSQIWMTTNGEGVFVFSTENHNLKAYTVLNGLASNYTTSILSDPSGNIWIGHSKGISKLIPPTGEIVNFNSGDGLQTREFSERASLILPDGRMVFAGFGGINLFNPATVTKDDKCPPVVFTRLLVSNELVSPSSDKKHPSPIKTNISLTDRIDLNYKQSVFTIEFMGINYNASQKIQYTYYLEGSDKDWNPLGHQNSVTFRNLRPGKYTFKVKASSPDAVWTTANIASLLIVIHPPIWATVWAYLFYSVLLLILFYFIGLFILVRIESTNNLKIERARREKEEELHQDKIQFFTNISHELRTPLTLIIGPLETMHSEETNEEKQSAIKLMLHNAKRLLAMVNQLLDFRKAEKGQMKLRVQYGDILLAINEVITSFEDLRRQKGISLLPDYQGTSLMGWFDPEFIQKSLINLVSNAFKFTGQGDTITISPRLGQDSLGNQTLSISVIDSGQGIPPKDLPFVFDRFYQGDEKSKLQQGTGIGLHLVKSLIELHHGTVEAESTPNVQTLFRFTIPIVKSAYLPNEFSDGNEVRPTLTSDMSGFISLDSEEEIIDIERKNRDNRKKILIVEDNSDIRNYIRGILGSQYVIEEAENGLIGWDLINLHEFDLVISDLMMPEMDGIEMCKRMKASVETDHIPLIMLTAKSDIENRIEGLSLGADSYITKPFHPKHLQVRVSKLIELREILKERYSRKISLGELHSPASKAESADEKFLQKSISVVLDKMDESEFNGDILASELGISRMGLYRKIKALTGQTTGEFIRNIRLKKACELLSADGKNISEVCYSVGFNSPSYFTTCFTEVYKMTPSEYAKKVKS